MRQAYVPFVPTSYVEGGRRENVELAGRDRYKYFKRPVVPLINDTNVNQAKTVPPPSHIQLQTKPAIGRKLPGLEGLPGQQAWATTSGGGARSAPRRAKKAATAVDSTLAASADVGGSHDAACQTDYRENDAQTDPYTPDYYADDAAPQPQVLALMDLKYGSGLPVGLAEVGMIDRIKRRTQVETDLPQGGDQEAILKRLRALEELEKIEWDERETHIKQLQENRLSQMAAALEQREQGRMEANSKRIEAVKRQKLEAAEQHLSRLQERRLGSTRKLAARYSNPSKEPPKKDIVMAYSTNGPRGKEVTTSSLVETAVNTNYDVRPTLLGFPEGVQELERTKAPALQRVKLTDTQPPANPMIDTLENNLRKRETKKVLRDLDFTQETINKARAGATTQCSIQDYYRATPRLVRPDTPTLALQGDDEEEAEESLVLLQRLMRGRAVQNEFFEGKERCHGLIEELQAASRAKENEIRWRDAKEAAQYTTKQQAVVESVVDDYEGDVLHATMVYLVKELTRQRELSDVERLRQKAESTRKTREDAEKQARAEEQVLRNRHEAQYKLLVSVTDYAATTYLERCFRSSVNGTAYEQALSEQFDVVAEQKAKEAVEEELTEVEKEVLVCDLLDTFVIPQVRLEQIKQSGEKATAARARAEEASSSAQRAVQEAFRSVRSAWDG
ncbi:hypothetical protein DIPPA_35114 [Diplonema papillatum]|nr:hypothetical protein DIPPA_35114 [Diplonema papillatum]